VGRLVGRLIVLLIVINLVAITLESIPEFEAQYTALFIAIELVSLAVFTVEYGLRMWVAVEQAPYLHSDGWKARLRYATSPIGVIDLLAVLPSWLAVVLPAEFKILLVFRIIRFLKLARYSPGMRSLLDVLYAERRALFGCLVIFIGATLVAATIMHIVERHVQPEKFGTIPDAMWWAIVTLGTIGYGDVVPVTQLGRIIAARRSSRASSWSPYPWASLRLRLPTRSTDAISSSPGEWWPGFPCFPSSTRRRSPISCTCCAPRRSRRARCSRAAASPRIPCIS
jgi:voltage-gated potassium channel